MISLKEKFTDVFIEMEENKNKWLELQKKCDAFKELSIKRTAIKCENIILEFLNEYKDKDFNQVKEYLDEFFMNDDIDEELKEIALLSMLQVIDKYEEYQEINNSKTVSIFMN